MIRATATLLPNNSESINPTFTLLLVMFAALKLYSAYYRYYSYEAIIDIGKILKNKQNMLAWKTHQNFIHSGHWLIA